ncbi:MAG: MoCo/4Fe-4S cofactor protein with predicted Tat translocation signal [Cyclobacteriaceae bacterium]|jgi:MoCo/4Fe-4S cofactor protein with predicted Tat translocation signal
MKETKKYWKGLEQLKNTTEFQELANKEFPEYLPLSGSEGEEPSRRDFLKLMGFGLAAVSLAACETPVRKAIPYVRKPENIDPSNANYYATTYVNGSDCLPVVVKTREGRPIKIEGNTLSSISGGGTSAQAQSSVLPLYDKDRLQSPQIEGKKATWADLDLAVAKGLGVIGGKVTIVSHSISSPSTLTAIDELTKKYPSVELIEYDQFSADGINSAYESAFGKRMYPVYDFAKAKTIVSFGYDFIGSAPNATLSSRQFAKTRKVGEDKKEMSRLYAFESNLSLTGANADYRTLIKPSQEGIYIANLYNAIASKTSASSIPTQKIADSAVLDKAASDLLKTKGSSLVLSGSNDKDIQSLVIAINNLLGSYGTTIDATKSLNIRKGDDKKFTAFVNGLKSGQVRGVIFYNCNPVYDHALGSQLAEGLAKAKFSLSTSGKKDETSSLVKILAPDHHYLESWNDFEPISGSYSLAQPTIKNIFDTRQAQDSFLTWAQSEKSYYDLMRSNWEASGYPSSTGFSSFDAYWDQCIHDGVYNATVNSEVLQASVDVAAAASGIGNSYSIDNTGLELVLYQNYGVGEGIQANNPWLQEMPDPITKATWDNYLTVSPKQVEEWGIELGDMKTQLVKLTVGDKTIDVPVMAQPGQAYGTMGLAVGYGRTMAGKVADGVGVNAYPFANIKNGSVSYTVTTGVSIETTTTDYRIAQTQTHQTYMGRETVIQEALLKEYQKDSQAGRSFPMIATADGPKKPYAVSLWNGHAYPNHHWGLMIDLNSCTGCGSCTVACQVENNIPVVGKAEVLNRREMHWIRIDRYYSSDATEGRDMENAAENPEVTFQPMMCQQCNNAPCETVCPVAATTHSSEGLNQMTYNRCIGTRYCANNCPYKVRRFNWFKYHDNKQFDKNMAMNNDLGKMVLNPDVTVRARGVMEKCTFCVQRIQSGKLEAKKEGRRPSDADITTACASACPSEALVFGDMKNPESKISQMLKIQQNEKGVESREPRAYHVLEEIRVMPNVWYLTKIRNKDEKAKKEVEA